MNCFTPHPSRPGSFLFHPASTKLQAPLPEGFASVQMLIAGLLIDMAAVHIDVAPAHFDLSACYMLPVTVHEALTRSSMLCSR